MKEKDVESYLREEVIRLGGFSRKYTSPGVVGVPDRIVFYHGVYFVETKRPTGVVSPMQFREFQRMHDQGAIVVLIKSKEDVDQFIAALQLMGELHETRQAQRQAAEARQNSEAAWRESDAQSPNSEEVTNVPE